MSKKIIATNRKAFHDYFIEDRYEAGIELVGTEIKSIRNGAVQLKDSYVDFVNGEAFIRDLYIAQYDYGNRFNHEERRLRKLLLHKHEINKLMKTVTLKGYTVVPLSIYLIKGKAKLEIALAKGKARYDKRETEREKSAQRDIERALKNQY